MELKFTLFIKFALGILILLFLFISLLGKIQFIPKSIFNSLTNLFYKFKHNNSFLFPNPSRGFVNEQHYCVSF